MSYVFNLGQITPLDTSLPNVFSLLFKISLYHEYANEIISYWTTGCKNLSNCITDYMKTVNNGDLKIFLGYNMFIYVFYDFYFVVFKVFINIHNIQIRIFTYLTTGRMACI